MDFDNLSRAADGPLPDSRTTCAGCGGGPANISNGYPAAGIGNGGNSTRIGDSKSSITSLLCMVKLRADNGAI